MNIAPIIIFLTGCYTSEAMRNPRSATDPRKNCETWSAWVDKNKPSLSAITEHEYMTSQEFANFCPATYAGKISKFECSTVASHSEAFNKNQTYSDFFIGCYDVHVGVTCTVTKAHSTDHCPDLKIRYFCTCLSSVPITQPPSTTKLGPVVQNTPANNTLGKGKAEKEGNLNLFGLSVSWWIFILALSTFLFLLNILVTVCLYQKATKKIRNHRRSKVHPLEKV